MTAPDGRRPNAPALALAAAFVGLATYAATRPVAPPRAAHLPDPRLTPGAVVPGVSRDTVCDPGYATRVRHVTDATKRAVCRAYGVPFDLKAYEIDHAIPLGIGGSNGESTGTPTGNLWPQPRSGRWSAAVKDRMEARVRAMVCRGEMTVEAAQELFRRDWTAGYVRVLGDPDRPRFGAAPGEPMDDDGGDEEGFPQEPRP